MGKGPGDPRPSSFAPATSLRAAPRRPSPHLLDLSLHRKALVGGIAEPDAASHALFASDLGSAVEESDLHATFVAGLALSSFVFAPPLHHRLLALDCDDPRQCATTSSVMTLIASELLDSIAGNEVVEGKGFEPSTSALRTPRSPN
jgi:hypothetical protein